MVNDTEPPDAETELRAIIRMAEDDGLTDLANRARIALNIVLVQRKTPAERPHEPR